MAKVEIYTSPLCGFCHAAKRLLDSKGVEYEEFDVMFEAILEAGDANAFGRAATQYRKSLSMILGLAAVTS